MKLLLNENIRNYRKKMSLTQEQLAEAMGVSVATVSKWESGSVSPDVAMLAELADFFQISVDVLLGYKWEKRGMGQCAKYIRKLRNERQYEEGVAEARKALQRYPNSFQVVYECGEMFFVAAMSQARDEQGRTNKEMVKDFEYAAMVLQKSLEMFEQNTDKDITLESICQDVGSIYAFTGKPEKAVSYLEEHNVCHINDKMIGMILCDMQEFDRAWVYVSNTFRRSMVDLWSNYICIWGILLSTEKYEKLLEMSRWMKYLCSSAAAEDGSYFIRAAAIVDAIAVTVYACKELTEKKDYTQEMKSYMREALQEAIRFDQNPDYTGRVRFFSYEAENMHDAFGDTGVKAVKHIMCCCVDDEVYDRLVLIYNEAAKSLELNDFLR